MFICYIIKEAVGLNLITVNAIQKDSTYVNDCYVQTTVMDILKAKYLIHNNCR